MGHRLPWCLLALAWLAAPAAAVAQVPRVLDAAPRTDFLSRFAYHLGIETLSGDDPQFQWDADFGGEFDIVGGPRWGRLEAAVVFHHTSRHLGDRAKDFGIAWNLLGAQATWTAAGPRDTWQLQARATTVVMKDAVDYGGEYSANALYVRQWRPRLAVVGRASGVVRTIDAGVSRRGAQAGARGEVALRIHGGAADVEIHAGVERRIEAAIFQPRPVTWALLGLRVLSR